MVRPLNICKRKGEGDNVDHVEKSLMHENVSVVSVGKLEPIMTEDQNR